MVVAATDAGLAIAAMAAAGAVTADGAGHATVAPNVVVDRVRAAADVARSRGRVLVPRANRRAAVR